MRARKPLRAAAALLALLLTFMLLPIRPAAAAEEWRLISSAEDWARLMKQCTVDTASDGLHVVLTDDLDLSALDDPVIPTFGGEFDGGGFTVTGVSITGAGTDIGLFRTLRAGGSIHDLTVKGSVSGGDGSTDVGGIVGVNCGTLADCAFSGTVTGETNVGGLVGSNGADALIFTCEFSGSVLATRCTGGIAGRSEGHILNCVNRGTVNHRATDTSIDLESMSLSSFQDTEDMTLGTDTGGICGYSSGTVQYSINRGLIGYPHTGYNIGGIVGRQCGYIMGCTNTGTVYGRKDVGGVVGQMEPYMVLAYAEDILQQVQAEVEALTASLANAAYHIKKASAEAHTHVEALSACIEGLSGDIQILAMGGMEYMAAFAAEMAKFMADPSYQPSFPSVSSSYKAAAARVASAVKNMAGEARAISEALGSGTAAAASSFSSAMTHVNTISTLLTGYQTELAGENGEIDYEDVSEAETADTMTGVVARCINRGTVEADLNVGGIAGAMAIEVDLDPEDDITVTGTRSLNFSYQTKALVRDCVNAGVVSAKRDCAGGIAGRQDLGSVLRSEAYGAVSSTDGDDVGGVVGAAYGTVRECYAFCTVSGNGYVGGVAGLAGTLTGNVSLTDIDADGAYVGAVAGMAEDITLLEGNVFCDETYAGVDGVTYTGRATRVTEKTLLATDGLPEEFFNRTLVFTADGETVAALTFTYGEAFDSALLPAVPQKEGYTAAWETLDGILTFPQTVEAAYTAYITTIATDGSAAPEALLEGRFGDGAALTAEGIPAPGQGWFKQKRLSVCDCRRVTLTGAEDGAEAAGALHILRPEGELLSVYLWKGGAWVKCDVETDGNYFVLEMQGTEAVIAVASAMPRLQFWIIAGGGGLLAAGALLWMLLALHKRSRGDRRA